MTTSVMAAEAAGQTEKPAVESTYNGDLTIELNTSDLNKCSVTPSREEIYKLGFSLNDLYKLSLQFYKKGKNTTYTFLKTHCTIQPLKCKKSFFLYKLKKDK